MSRGPHRSTRRWSAWGLALALLAACSPGWERLSKPRRSAVWVPAGVEVAFSVLPRLERVGVEELFVEAARMEWDGSTPRLEALPLFELSRRTGVTLVIGGVWQGAEDAAEPAAEALAAELAALAPEAARAGLVPLGYHFDLAAGDTLEGYGAGLAALQEHLEPTLYLSATVERWWLDRPGLQRVADAVDFIVPFVYGQRPGEREDDAAWDFQQVEAHLRRIEELDRDYLAGVVTVGRLVHVDARGTPLAETTRGSLGTLVRHPGLELGYGFTLQGLDRQVYRFEAEVPVRVGEWTVAAGQGVRVAGAASHHVEALRDRLADLEEEEVLERRLGDLYYRLPLPGEGLSLSLGSLVNALSSQVAAAAPRARLTPGGRGTYTVELINASDEPTDVAYLGTNYVELQATEGTFGNVDPGEFPRWELLRPGRGGELVRAFRGATVLRFYVPYLAPGERVSSGTVQLVGGEEGGVVIAGEFMVPGGEVVAVEEAPPEPEEDEDEEAPPSAGRRRG